MVSLLGIIYFVYQTQHVCMFHLTCSGDIGNVQITPIPIHLPEVLMVQLARFQGTSADKNQNSIAVDKSVVLNAVEYEVSAVLV